ncbi:very short patch repair endonuclease [Microbacterium sp. ABRD28]|uniref:very short patch repair endonuclease n=1 Tax=Microbacterium sp. ABRD28 TaxID=2268461 RepID=UPI000F553D7C|nr:very short patch repair endonuclease [Microbacterium sp. ABRD28]AZC14464.1 very short patch repair endonuclease [Microbacterium sp. ABRD28]
MAESWASSETSRRTMLANRRRDTMPELRVRKLLHAAGLRYRVDVAPIPMLRSRADIVFTRRRIAIFIDGCFWHGCPLHGTTPRANADYWVPKLARNTARDTETTATLTQAGWHVLRYWEHESPDLVAHAIVEVWSRHSSADARGA